MRSVISRRWNDIIITCTIGIAENRGHWSGGRVRAPTLRRWPLTAHM